MPLVIEVVDPRTLAQDPANARVHDERNLDAIKGSLARFGQVHPIVVGKNGIVIAGNGRLAAALELGWTEIQIVRSELTGVEATAFAIADNRTAELASWDDEALAKLLRELRDEDAIAGVGFEDDEIDALIAALDDGELEDLDDPGPQEPPEKPVTQPGDLWILGEHRLLCGDSTRRDEIGRLMAGATAMLLATDPPYLVDYDGTNHPADHHRKAGRQPSRPVDQVGNKHWDAYVDPETSVEFFRLFLEAALTHCHAEAPVYQWHASRRQMLVEQAWLANELLLHQTIVWVKPRAVLTRSHFLWKSEPCFYGWRKGNQPPTDRRPPPDRPNVWEIDGERDGIHPTQKPRMVFGWPIEWHTRPGEVVLEPFSGSGTQIIAAEERRRRCFAMEISPGFVDAAIARWQKATGKAAVLDGAGMSFAEVAASRVA